MNDRHTCCATRRPEAVPRAAEFEHQLFDLFHVNPVVSSDSGSRGTKLRVMLGGRAQQFVDAIETGPSGKPLVRRSTFHMHNAMRRGGGRARRGVRRIVRVAPARFTAAVAPRTAKVAEVQGVEVDLVELGQIRTPFVGPLKPARKAIVPEADFGEDIEGVFKADGRSARARHRACGDRRSQFGDRQMPTTRFGAIGNTRD